LKVLVSFGGSDPLGATPRAVRAVVGAAPARIVVVAGAGFRHREELEAAIVLACSAGHVVDYRGPVADMAGLMAGCDVAICGAGGTLAELAYLGRPAAAYAVAPDQVEIAAAQAAAGLVHGGIDLATAEKDALAASVQAFLGDAGRRAEIAARAARTVDGRGAERIVAALR
jgi:spore coat polysaccharide biosynthesis predicted glycosyltransferase SpsG